MVFRKNMKNKFYIYAIKSKRIDIQPALAKPKKTQHMLPNATYVAAKGTDPRAWDAASELV